MKLLVAVVTSYFCLLSIATAFVAPLGSPAWRQQKPHFASTQSQDVRSESFVLSRDEINPLIQIGNGEKEKLVNSFGLWCAAVSLALAPIWSGAMSLVNAISQMNKDWDTDRSIHDKTGKIWAKTWLTLTSSYPTITGNVDRLKEGQGPCLFVANHASWLDIPVLCTVLDPVFKFIAKGELRSVPCIGQQLVGGDHILIDRTDRRSQLRTFKQAVSWLKSGVPIMAFPEGMRSRDGRLMDFKGGLFSMAVKTGVPIVPITISHTHAVMPANALFPVQSGAGKLKVHIHDAIDVTDRTEAELGELVRDCFLSELPLDQHPIVEIQKEINGGSNVHVVVEKVASSHHVSSEALQKLPTSSEEEKERVVLR